MNENNIFSTLLFSLGISIIGGAVAGYILITHPDNYGYYTLLIFSLVLIIIGIYGFIKKSF